LGLKKIFQRAQRYAFKDELGTKEAPDFHHGNKVTFRVSGKL